MPILGNPHIMWHWKFGWGKTVLYAAVNSSAQVFRAKYIPEKLPATTKRAGDGPSWAPHLSDSGLKCQWLLNQFQASALASFIIIWCFISPSPDWLGYDGSAPILYFLFAHIIPIILTPIFDSLKFSTSKYENLAHETAIHLSVHSSLTKATLW